MNAFIGRLMCCVVVFAAPRLSTSSAHVLDALDTARRDDERRSTLSDESESDSALQSPDSDELEHVDRIILTLVAVSFSEMLPVTGYRALRTSKFDNSRRYLLLVLSK